MTIGAFGKSLGDVVSDDNKVPTIPQLGSNDYYIVVNKQNKTTKKILASSIYSEVDTFANLPSSGMLTNDIVVVRTTTGVIGFRKLKGLYIYTGTAWERLSPSFHATNVYYDNSSSGLSATNVNTAIDELHDLVGIIDDESVTNEKIAHVATGTVKGRVSASMGDVEDLDIDTTLKTALGLVKSDVGLGNVENKSSATIRGEIVDSDIPSTIARDSEIPSGNQVLDWTADQGSTNIHSGNYTNTTYSVGDGELSQNNLTNSLKTNYDTAYTHSQSTHSPSNAEANVQSDWNSNSGDSKILNKPTIPSGNQVLDWTADQGATNIHSGNYTNTTYSVGDGELSQNNLTNSLKTNYDTAYTHSQSTHSPSNAEANVQSDWNSNSGDSKILNKPTIPSGNQVLDWTADQGSTNIHSGNYTNTTYSVGDGGLTQKNFTTSLKSKLDGIESGATADQTKADIDALGINSGQVDGLEASQFLRSDAGDTLNVGRGNIYFENNSNDNQGGAGLTIRTSNNPSDGDEDSVGSIFAIRSSNQAARLWVGQSKTTTGDNDFVTNDATFNGSVDIKKTDNNVADHLKFYNGTTRVGEIGVEDAYWLRINQETNKNIFTPRMFRADGGFQVDGSDVITGSGVHTGNGSGLITLNASNISSGTLNASRLPASATFGNGISTNGKDVYTNNGAIIAFDYNNGAFGSRTGTNIDHLWHDDSSNAWHLCSDTTYKATGNSKLFVGSVVASGNIKSGDSNSDVVIGEHSTYPAYGSVHLDGESFYRLLMSPGSHTFLNALGSGHIYFRNDNATLVEINDQGDIIGSAKFKCYGQAEVNGATRYSNVGFNSRGMADWIYYGENNSGSGKFGVRNSDGTVWSSSDRRVKKNIESMSNILNKVCECVLSKFHFKTQKDSELKSIGFISQEIEPIFPELVETMPDDYKSLNYDRFGVVALQAIKELREEKDTQIQLLEERIKKLEAKL